MALVHNCASVGYTPLLHCMLTGYETTTLFLSTNLSVLLGPHTNVSVSPAGQQKQAIVDFGSSAQVQRHPLSDPGDI
jgi:hypothetical protein